MSLNNKWKQASHDKDVAVKEACSHLVISVPFLSAASGTRTFVDIFSMYIVLHMERSKESTNSRMDPNRMLHLEIYNIIQYRYVYKAVWI